MTAGFPSSTHLTQLPNSRTHHTAPTDNRPDLIYCDEFLLVVNKAAGLLAVPGRGMDKQDCLSARVQKDFPDALVVHRLDMATSGLMMFARGAEMQRRLSRMFRERGVEKRYVAVLGGNLAAQSGEVNLAIVADWANRPLRKIDVETGKPSLTRFRVLSYTSEPATTRVELEPVTGRTHQLRVHMSAIGHPVLGDALYGIATSASRLLLHAASLNFAHPLSGVAQNFISEPPF